MEILSEVLVKDKFQNINLVTDMLRNEIFAVLKNYLIMEDGIVIRYKKEGEKFVFNIEVTADRIKPMGVHCCYV